MKIFTKKETIIYYILALYFLVGLTIYKDFGVGIEEHFQRSSGFYWLNYVLQFTDFEFLKDQVIEKITQIKDLYPNLPSVEIAKNYGVVFDLPMALLETLLNFSEGKDQFYLRHFFNFFIFLTSGFAFYLLILGRTKTYYVAISSCLFYLLSPRIFGNSFFDGKDLFFLSLVTFTFYFYFLFNKNKSITTILIFSFFSALCTSTRIIGFIFPISFLMIKIFKIINNYKNKKNYYELLLYFTFYFLFLFIHWPYLWTLEFSELSNFLLGFRVIANPEVFFNGNYYISEYLPFNYIPLWIFISTPEIIIGFFIFGFIFYTFRIFKRFININESLRYNDLWRGMKEKVDFFILFSLFQVLIVYLSFSINLYGGWRHFLFLNFFVVYFASYGIYLFSQKIRNNLNYKKFYILFLIFFTIQITYELYKYHPFQSMYFNNFVTKKMKKNFEVDTQSLSRVAAIRDVIRDTSTKEQVYIGTASWTPLENGRSLIDKSYWKKLNFIGTENKQKADYIYTNFYYEVNPQFEKKYKIPENFKLFKSLSIDNTIIYSIYKKTQ